jgi:hypothetical protein
MVPRRAVEESHIVGARGGAPDERDLQAVGVARNCFDQRPVTLELAPEPGEGVAWTGPHLLLEPSKAWTLERDRRWRGPFLSEERVFRERQECRESHPRRESSGLS